MGCGDDDGASKGARTVFRVATNAGSKLLGKPPPRQPARVRCRLLSFFPCDPNTNKQQQNACALTCGLAAPKDQIRPRPHPRAAAKSRPETMPAPAVHRPMACQLCPATLSQRSCACALSSRAHGPSGTLGAHESFAEDVPPPTDRNRCSIWKGNLPSLPKVLAGFSCGSTEHAPHGVRVAAVQFCL